ncbi:hypothetical protein TRVL_01829 [Trypanosoma vivax]|nr:hypothetical protein TRVL_01829 [Trypanosoma vivax]
MLRAVTGDKLEHARRALDTQQAEVSSKVKAHSDTCFSEGHGASMTEQNDDKQMGKGSRKQDGKVSRYKKDGCKAASQRTNGAGDRMRQMEGTDNERKDVNKISKTKTHQEIESNKDPGNRGHAIDPSGHRKRQRL